MRLLSSYSYRFLFLFLFLTLFPALSFAQSVLYGNPMRDELSLAYNDLSLMSLQEQETSSLEAQYLLGMAYLNGNSKINVGRDFSKARELLRSAWEGGVADAGLALSSIYYVGAGVEKNYSKALDYLTLSAEYGYIRSQRQLGKAYLGVAFPNLVSGKNVKKAVKWLSRAAHGGDLRSAALLSSLYSDGDVVPRDYKESLKWMKNATSSKYGQNIAAFPLLAEFYEMGWGTDVNLVKAYKYYDLGGSSGNEGKARLVQHMTQEQIDEAIRQSQEWQKEHNVQVGGDFIRRAN